MEGCVFDRHRIIAFLPPLRAAHFFNISVFAAFSGGGFPCLTVSTAGSLLYVCIFAASAGGGFRCGFGVFGLGVAKSLPCSKKVYRHKARLNTSRLYQPRPMCLSLAAASSKLLQCHDYVCLLRKERFCFLIHTAPLYFFNQR